MKIRYRTPFVLIGTFSIIVSFASGCTTPTGETVESVERATDIATKEVYEGRLGDYAMFASPAAKQSGVMIGTWPTPEKLRVTEESWFLFVDEAPEANWEHPAKFILVEKESGKVRIHEVMTPPRELSKMRPISVAAQRQFDIMERNSRSIREVSIDKPILIKKYEKYAVLVSGGWDAGNNHARYWNDLSFIYKALKDKYGYTDAEIIVLYANGTHLPDEDLDGDGSDDVDYSATKTNLTTVMQQVANFIDKDGKFFFYSTNHGGYESGHDAYLYLWGETILDDEFATLTKTIKGKHAVYVMEQCYSGSMMDDVLTAQTYPCNNPQVCVMTAAKHDEVSWAADTEGAYDEYVYHWTSAIYGQTPTGTIVNADADGDGIVSMDEAHEYAKNEDSRSEHPLIGSCIASACGASL